MRPYAILLASAVTCCASFALAHGPTPKKIDESIEVKADPKAVWALAGAFAGISKWDPELKASEGDDKKRTMTFQNGQKLEEETDEYDAGKMTYSYRMSNPNVKALPVSSYTATFAVTPADGGSKIEWSGRYYRGDTGNEPSDDLNDAAGKAAMSKFFKAGLDGIKAQLEKKS